MKATILLAALLCLGPTRAVRDEPTALRPFLSLSGQHSHVTDKRCLRITNQDEWAALWFEHVGEKPRPKLDLFYNKAGLPVVDFERCMVVAVFAGALFNCAGVSAVEAPEPPVKLDEATAAGPASEDEVALYLSWHSFQTAGPAPDGGAQAGEPFGFFVLPRTDAPLVLRDVRRGKGGDSVRVAERARFPRLQSAGR